MIKVGYFFIQLLEDKRLPFAQAALLNHMGIGFSANLIL